MKKYMFLAAAAVVALASCNNASPKMDEQPAAAAAGESNTLNQKGQALQNAAANFQQKLQNNGFTSREQAESQQAAIQRQQQSLQELQARLENELANETNKYNEGLRDSLQHFLAAYNKDKKYDLILTKQGDNILYAAKRFDITNDVINGLNKRYKSTLKTETKKEEKK